MPALTIAKQEKFCREWIKDGNGKQAAIRAGYSPKSATEQGSRLLSYANVQNRIAELMSKMESKDIADAKEVMQFLTSMMRGEIKEEVIVGNYDATRTVEKQAPAKERNKAAELLAKRYGLLSDKQEANDEALSKLDQMLKGIDNAAKC